MRDHGLPEVPVLHVNVCGIHNVLRRISQTPRCAARRVLLSGQSRNRTQETTYNTAGLAPRRLFVLA